MSGGELVPGLGLWRKEPAELPAPAALARFADAFAEIIKVFDAMAAFSRQVDEVYGPPVRRMARYVKLHNHRRHQDKRRCYAKQARREYTGWRQL